MIYRIQVFAILFLFSAGLNAQEHLEPNSNIFEDYEFQYEYYSQVRDLLLEGLSEQPVAQLIIIPSFSKEIVWQVQHESGKYQSVVSTANHSIWYNQYEETPRKLKQNISRNEITSESAELIKKLYHAALKTVRYSEDRQGFDGTNYYFSAFDSRLKSGTIWSPKEGSKMRELVDISQQIISETQKKSKLSNSLIERILKLISELE